MIWTVLDITKYQQKEVLARLCRGCRGEAIRVHVTQLRKACYTELETGDTADSLPDF